MFTLAMGKCTELVRIEWHCSQAEEEGVIGREVIVVEHK